VAGLKLAGRHRFQLAGALIGVSGGDTGPRERNSGRRPPRKSAGADSDGERLEDHDIEEQRTPTLLVYLLTKIVPEMAFGVVFLLGVLVVSAGWGFG
jgi:hypothetical protein